MFASENKPCAVSVLTQNHPGEAVHGDIRKIDANAFPDFDFMLAGFPCQAFSATGKRLGFQDNRGNLFFEVERIQKIKKPYGFVLENVDGLETMTARIRTMISEKRFQPYWSIYPPLNMK